MATAEQAKKWARLRRLYMYHVRMTTDKTDAEIAKGFGVGLNLVKDVRRRIEFDQGKYDSKEKLKEERFQRDLAYLLPIIEDIKGLTKNGGG